MIVDIENIRTREYKVNNLGQSIGLSVDNWVPRLHPSNFSPPVGKYVKIEHLDVQKHGNDLYDAFSLSSDDSDWTYSSCGPFSVDGIFNKSMFLDFLSERGALLDPYCYVIIDLTSNKAIGMFSLFRMDLVNGSIEMAFVVYSKLLKQTRMATEAQFLMMKFVFKTMGFRRYEWKCDSRHMGSRNAATRLGFTLEGLFRNATMYKGRTRDTCWFSIMPCEFIHLETAFERYLDKDNFIEEKQIQPLSVFIKSAQTIIQQKRNEGDILIE